MTRKILSQKKAAKLQKNAEQRAKDRRVIIVTVIILGFVAGAGIIYKAFVHRYTHHGQTFRASRPEVPR